MGLDTTHGAWSGSYGSFHYFRNEIAKKININLDEMQGFGGLKEWPEKEPLVHLLSHSDCDGDITPKRCAAIAKRLEELGDVFDDEGWQNRLKQFIKGCKLAAKKNQRLEFH